MTNIRKLADGLTDAEIQAMFDRPPTAEEERYDQIRAEIDALGNIDPRPLLVMQRLEIQRLRARIDAVLSRFDMRSELFTNDADLIAYMVDTLRGGHMDTEDLARLRAAFGAE